MPDPVDPEILSDFGDKLSAAEELLSNLNGLAESGQSLLKRITETPETIVENIENEPVIHALEEAQGAAEELDEVVSDLIEYPEETNDMMTERVDEFIATGDEQFDEILNEFSETSDRLNLARTEITETFEAALQSILEQLEGMDERMVTFTEDQIESKSTELADNFEEELQNAIDEQLNSLSEVGDLVEGHIDREFDQLKKKVSEELEEAIKEEAEELMDDAVKIVQEEVMQAILTSQLQVQLTSLISPYLPQLMTVRVVASSVRSALEIMRAGV